MSRKLNEQIIALGDGYRKAWHALWQELTTVGDGVISGEDVIKMMSRIEEDKLPPMEGDEQAEKTLKRIASVLSDYGGIRTLFSMKEEDLNFEEKALAHIYEILQGVDEQ